MKVLFVYSGNKKAGISPFVKSQGESLIKAGIELDYFPILGHGIFGYIRAIIQLRKYLKLKKYDIIHAHYALSGWVALLAKKRTPILISLMGDDAYGTYDEHGKVKILSYLLILTSKLLQPFVSAIIVKSKNIYKTVWFKNKTAIIPNGVDINQFIKIDKKIARNKLNLPIEKKMVVYLANPKESRKNIVLAKKAINISDMEDSFLVPYPIKHEDIAMMLSAADVLLSTSTAEGSSNLIKEAMSCGCPIVSTDVGDVQWVLGNTEGCFLTSFDPKDVSLKLLKAIEFSTTNDRTNGRDRILELGLDLESTANNLFLVYQKVLS